MKKNDGANFSDFDEFQNVRAKIKVNMLLDEKDIKKLDDIDFEDVREIDLKKDAEFDICDLGNETEISFEFGSIKIDKGKFAEILKRYLGRNEFVGKL